VFMRGEVDEICDFTQQVHLGIESYLDWLDAKHKRQAERRFDRKEHKQASDTGYSTTKTLK